MPATRRPRPGGLLVAMVLTVGSLVACRVAVRDGAQAPLLAGSPCPADTTPDCSPSQGSMSAGAPGAAEVQSEPPGQPGGTAGPPGLPLDPVVVSAGDIAWCGGDGDTATAALLDRISGTVATLGDNAYDAGTPQEFRACYGPTWGRHRDRTRPALGNHDYRSPGASGYFDYFGDQAGEPGKGWYSYDLGPFWHVIALNSNCDAVGGCGPGSPQERWLRADLAAHADRHVVAYWHHPRFSSGRHGGTDATRAFWDALHEYGAEVVLNGHDHSYERLQPVDPAGRPDPLRGIRQFVVGTGGRSLYRFSRRPLPITEARHDATFGVLVLTLHAQGYDWRFVPTAGGTFTDQGSALVH